MTRFTVRRALILLALFIGLSIREIPPHWWDSTQSQPPYWWDSTQSQPPYWWD